MLLVAHSSFLDTIFCLLILNLALRFKKEEFIEINMKHYLKEYSMFDDLKYRDFGQNKGDAIRAQHSAWVDSNT